MDTYPYAANALILLRGVLDDGPFQASPVGSQEGERSDAVILGGQIDCLAHRAVNPEGRVSNVDHRLRRSRAEWREANGQRVSGALDR